jgi:hypothetical protein
MRLACAFALFVCACGKDDPMVDPIDAPAATDGAPPAMRWLPMATGNTWTYLVTPLGAPAETKTQTVMALQEVPGKTGVTAYFVVTEKIDGRTESWQEDRGDRIVRHREVSFDSLGAMNGLELYEPYKLRVDETAEHTMVGAAWTDVYQETIDGGAPVSRASNWTVEAVAEAVTVPAGTFTCLKVRRMGTEFGQSDKRFWFAQGVGKIKEEGDQIEELMDYTLP